MAHVSGHPTRATCINDHFRVFASKQESQCVYRSFTNTVRLWCPAVMILGAVGRGFQCNSQRFCIFWSAHGVGLT